MTQAETLLRAFDSNRQIPLLSQKNDRLDLDTAYALAAEIAALRVARGEVITGRKIGFTNRTIWPIYNVNAPLWGYMYDSTVADLPADGRVQLPALPEPRLEPEIAFGFARSPSPDMSLAEVADCLEWVAHGFEIVVSLFPNWKVTAPDAVAGFGMHGAFWLGPKRPAQDILADGLSALKDFSLTLHGPNEEHTGAGTDVLGGPLHALQHLLLETARMPGALLIQPGEVVTTGTLTDARPIAPGQVWETKFSGLALPGLRIEFI